MALIQSSNYNAQLTTNIDPQLDADSDSNSIALSKFNVQGSTLNATSSPKAEASVTLEQSLSGGALTIDLTAAVDELGNTVDLTGKRLLRILMTNPEGNNPITIGEGASNGYPLFGTGNDFELPPKSNNNDGNLLASLGEAKPLVSASVKNIDFSGTGTESFKLALIFGS